MPTSQLLELIAFPVIIAVGQLLFKHTAQSVGQPKGASWLLLLMQSPGFWVALVLYGASTILWVKILSSIPLNRAYPFVALSYVIVPVVGYLIFDELLTMRYLLGISLIIAGVVISGGAR